MVITDVLPRVELMSLPFYFACFAWPVKLLDKRSYYLNTVYDSSYQQPFRDLFLGSPAPGFLGRGIIMFNSSPVVVVVVVVVKLSCQYEHTHLESWIASPGSRRICEGFTDDTLVGLLRKLMRDVLDMAERGVDEASDDCWAEARVRL
jgi:hypothetical protein